MASKMDVVLLQSVKGLWNKNDLVSVAVSYAKNVLFPKWLAKQADAIAKNNLAQKKEQQKKHTTQVSEIWEQITLYAQAHEPLYVNRKATPAAKLYEKVREIDVREAMQQRGVTLPSDIVIVKKTWEELWEHEAVATYNNKKITITFVIKEIF